MRSSLAGESGLSWAIFGPAWIMFGLVTGSVSVLHAQEAGAGAQSQEHRQGAIDSLKAKALLAATRGELPDAEALTRRALTFAESLEDTAQAGRLLADLAELEQQQANYADAEVLYKQALERVGDDLEVARISGSLAGLFEVRGSLVQADSLYEAAARALEGEQAVGRTSLYSVRKLNTLASLHFAQGQYGEATSLAERSLTILQESLDPAAANNSDAVHHLAALFFALERYPESEMLHRAALAGRENPDHLAVLARENHLPSGETSLARQLHEASLAQSQNNLAVVLESMGQHAEADSLYHEALLHLENTVGRDHPRFATLAQNLYRNTRRSPSGRGGFEFNASIGILNDFPDEYTPDFAGDQLRRDARAGARVGYTFPFNLFVQAEALNALLEVSLRNGEPRKNLETFIYGAAAGYNIQPGRRLQLYPTLGFGVVRFEADGFASETSFTINYGIGARYFLTPHVALRADARVHQVFDALESTRTQANPLADLANDDLFLADLSVGLSYFLGGPYDSDDDGVENGSDDCPDTTRGARVTSKGCPVDADGDGIADYTDRCPGTPSGANVNQVGCPNDEDGDGVFEGPDACPDTQAGALVDAIGCHFDDDRDGIPDGIDRCLDSPDEAVVNERGCASDSDHDGIVDGRDLCPTPVTDTGNVNERGCTGLGEDLLRGRFALDSVEFASNSAELTAGSAEMLDALGRILTLRSDLRVEVQGHTDSAGSADHNLDLSQRRADAVREYLITRFSDPDHPTGLAGRIEARGYGSDRPLVPNDSPAGRARNRRVGVEVISAGGS